VPDSENKEDFESRDTAPADGDAGSQHVTEEDLSFMDLALAEARRAEALDEVPIGAVIVLEGRVIGRGHNRTRADATPLAHAELLAIGEAARATGDARLVGATVYTTVEPCFMCAGALSHARVARVVWGVRDPKFGGCASLGAILSDPRLNHRAEITEGVRADEARELLQTFFRSKRQGARKAKG
jgi:tRNA(adenine34) deaminase